MPKKVRALKFGYHDGKGRNVGDEFIISDKHKPGKWMKVLKDVPAEASDEEVDKDALIAEAKSYGIENVTKNWGVNKIQEAIDLAKEATNPG